MYITIEGLDGSGKTTVAEGLARALREKNIEVTLTQEPCEDLWTGQAVREALKQETAAMTDVFLFMADRAEHIKEVVKPAIRRGDFVISDRGHDSTYAYQSGRIETWVASPWAWLDQAYTPWNLEPDITLYIDVSIDTATERMDGLEKYETLTNLRRVRRQYEDLDIRHDRFKRIDGEQPKDLVLADAVEAIYEEC